MHLCWMLDFVTIKKIERGYHWQSISYRTLCIRKRKRSDFCRIKKKHLQLFVWGKNYISNMSFNWCEKKTVTGNKAQVSTCCRTRLYKRHKWKGLEFIFITTGIKIVIIWFPASTMTYIWKYRSVRSIRNICNFYIKRKLVFYSYCWSRFSYVHKRKDNILLKIQEINTKYTC